LVSVGVGRGDFATLDSCEIREERLFVLIVSWAFRFAKVACWWGVLVIEAQLLELELKIEVEILLVDRELLRVELEELGIELSEGKEIWLVELILFELNLEIKSFLLPRSQYQLV
jgi:hypothetical protein